MKLNDIPVGVFYYIVAGYEISVAETDLAARREAEVTLGRVFTKIILFDVQNLRERDAAGSHALVFGIVDGVHMLDEIVRIVVDDNAQWPQHCHNAWRAPVQVFSDVVLESREFHRIVSLGYAQTCAKTAYGFRRVAAPPHP